MAAKTTLQHCTHVFGNSGKLPDLGRVDPWYGTNMMRHRTVYYKTRMVRDQFQLYANHRIEVVGTVHRYGFLIPMPVESYQWCIDQMVEMLRKMVGVDGRGKQFLGNAFDDEFEEPYDYTREQIEQCIRERCNAAFTELSTLYRGSPSFYTQVDYLANYVCYLAEEIVNKEIRTFNKTVSAPVKPKPEYDVLKATEDLKQVIAHKHMKSIRAACVRLKLNVNDYLYALQDVIDDPQSIQTQVKGIHIID